MGNALKGVSDEKLAESEKQMLSFIGLPLEDFDMDNVAIDSQGNFVRTIHIGAGEGRPLLVLVHGYGGSGLLFYRIVKPLVEAGLHVILIDILGMGSSSRPEFDKEMTADQADLYFVDFLEKWRIAMGDIRDFFLAGHSFGGYICGHYAIKHSDKIRKLLMLSPAGVVVKPENYVFGVARPRNGQGPPKFVQNIARLTWKHKWSPFGMMRKSGGLIGKKLIKTYITRRLSGTLSPHEFDVLLDYMHQIFMREGSTEYALFIQFELGMWAINPLETRERLGSLPIPVSFFYGDRDWMDYRGGQRVIEQNRFYNAEAKEKGLSQVYIISDSDHHLYFDNPVEFAKLIVQDVQMTLDASPAK